MQFANRINDLVVKFIRLDLNETVQAEMLVMERLYPLTTGLMRWRYGNSGSTCSRIT